MGPQFGTLKEGPAPMAAGKSGTESVLLGREMGGDQGKDIQRDAIYWSKGVDPLADSHQSSRGIPVELKNVIQGEPSREVSIPAGGAMGISLTTENMLHASVPRSERRRVVKVTGPFQGKLACP